MPVLVAPLFLATARAQAAEPAISFTTYLREGPGLRYRALQEALTGTRVSLGACVDGWCRIRSGDVFGYVAQGALRDVSAPPAAGPATCFSNRQAGYLDGRDLTVCYPSAAVAPRPSR